MKKIVKTAQFTLVFVGNRSHV